MEVGGAGVDGPIVPSLKAIRDRLKKDGLNLRTEQSITTADTTSIIMQRQDGVVGMDRRKATGEVIIASIMKNEVGLQPNWSMHGQIAVIMCTEQAETIGTTSKRDKLKRHLVIISIVIATEQKRPHITMNDGEAGRHGLTAAIPLATLVKLKLERFTATAQKGNHST